MDIHPTIYCSIIETKTLFQGELTQGETCFSHLLHVSIQSTFHQTPVFFCSDSRAIWKCEWEVKKNCLYHSDWVLVSLWPLYYVPLPPQTLSLGFVIIIIQTLLRPTSSHIVPPWEACPTCLLHLNLSSLLPLATSSLLPELLSHPHLQVVICLFRASTCLNVCCLASVPMDLFTCFDCQSRPTLSFFYWPSKHSKLFLSICALSLLTFWSSHLLSVRIL